MSLSVFCSCVTCYALLYDVHCIKDKKRELIRVQGLPYFPSEMSWDCICKMAGGVSVENHPKLIRVFWFPKQPGTSSFNMTSQKEHSTYSSLSAWACRHLRPQLLVQRFSYGTPHFKRLLGFDFPWPFGVAKLRFAFA